MPTYSLSLPRSGLIAQWCDDGTAQIGSASDACSVYWGTTSAFRSSDPDFFPYVLKQQVCPGDRPDPTWWLLISALERPAAVSAALADGSRVPVHRLGPLILCEWESTPQRLIVSVDAVARAVEPFRPSSKGPAPFPYEPSDAGGDRPGPGRGSIPPDRRRGPAGNRVDMQDMMTDGRGGFLANYPFADLLMLGWRFVCFAPPETPPGVGIGARRALFVDDDNRTMTFDVDRHGQMHDHAIYAAGGDIIMIADSPHAALLLAASPLTAHPSALLEIRGVTEFRD